VRRQFPTGLALALLISLACAPCPAGAAPSESNDARAARAIRAREAGDYATAIRILQEVVKVEPRAEWLGLLAETQAWDKKFEEAERVYRSALKRFPGSRDLELGLARVLAWQGRYPEARLVLSRLVNRNSDDVEALESLGLVEYWSGDFRSASRDFRRVLRKRPESAEARRGVAGIESASAARYEVSTAFGSDDQPYRVGRLQTKASVFSDPLTRWDGAVGSYVLRAAGQGDANGVAPFARVGTETVIPSGHLTITPWIEALRFPDGYTEGLWGIALRHALGPWGDVTVRASRQELLLVRSSIDEHPSVTSVGASWDWKRPSGWLARLEASRLRYFDANDGWSASGFALAPLGSLSGFTFSIGPAVSYQDADESRFQLASSVSVPLGGGAFRYEYTGQYDPYWTPHHLWDVHLTAVVQGNVSRNLTAKVQADGGYAHDRAVGFGPETGFTAVPPAAFSFFFDRTYHPWRLAASLTETFTCGARLEVGYEHQVTVFYTSDALHATLGGRF
jgi:tetratricopeptide (TPR) repeat protein